MSAELMSRAAAVLSREVARMSIFDTRVAAKLPNSAETSASPPVNAALSMTQARWLQHAQELVASMRELLSQPSLGGDPQVPLISCLSPVQAGSDARAMLRVANDEASASEVTLYASNFIADTGCDIPSLRVDISPRTALIPAHSEVTFNVRIAVPMQAPGGLYSGLIQASGCKYVKTVVSLQVL